MSDSARPFTSYDVQTCLYDQRRVELFAQAITAAVRQGAVVVDAGSGTGVLGLLAAKAGARRVYCVEVNPDFARVIKENAARNGLASRIVVVSDNASTWAPPEPLDVIICETISAGHFYEPQLQILANLTPHLHPGGVVLPYAMQNRVELLDAQQNLYGLTLSYDPRFRALDGDLSLTTCEPYLTTSFRDVTGATVDAQATVRAVRPGLANALRITYGIEFIADQGWVNEPTEFLMNPQVIFLETPVPLEPECEYLIELRYQGSASPLDSSIAVSRSDQRARVARSATRARRPVAAGGS